MHFRTSKNSTFEASTKEKYLVVVSSKELLLLIENRVCCRKKYTRWVSLVFVAQIKHLYLIYRVNKYFSGELLNLKTSFFL